MTKQERNNINKLIVYTSLELQAYGLTELRANLRHNQKNQASKELVFVNNQLKRYKTISKVTKKEVEDSDNLVHENVALMANMIVQAALLPPHLVDKLDEEFANLIKKVIREDETLK